MNTKTYLIIGIIAVVLIIYFTLLQKGQNKRKARQVGEIKSRLSRNSITEEQKRLLVFGAVLFYHRMEDILGLLPKKILNEYKQGLAEQWEIYDRETAKETIADLLALKRSSEYDSYLVQPSPDLKKIQKDVAKELKINLSEVEAVQSTYGWDLMRAASLAKWCFWCGYLTEEEMWQILQKVSNVANEKGESWHEYTISFLVGRTMQGFNILMIGSECNILYHYGEKFKRKNKNLDVYKKYAYQN